MKRLPRTTALLTALLALTVFVYWPGLNGPLILDDVSNLDILRRLSDQGRLSLANILAERGGFVGGRPVSWMSFLANWHLTPADVWSFKLVNLMIHLLNGLLVFGVARGLFSAVGLGSDSSRAWLALVACGFWLLTPLQVSAVLYLVQRMTLLAALFTLAGLGVYVLARTRVARRPVEAGVLMAVSIVVCWPLATLSKQNGALLVPLLLAVELLVFSPRDAAVWPRRALTVLTVLLLGVGALRFALDPQWVLDTYPLRDFTLEQRLLTQPRVLVDYALNVLQLPGGAALGLFHDDFAISTSLLSPWQTLPAIAGWLGVGAAAWRWRGRPAGLIPAGLVFFAVAHALEAGPFALEMYFEHRNYLPSVGIWVAMVAAIALVAERVSRPRLLASLLAVVLTGHAALTAARVSVWRSFEDIVESNARSHPGSRRARAGAAVVAFESGDLQSGLGHLEAVRAIAGPSAELPVVLKSLVGYCLAGREPDAPLLSRLHAVERIVVDPYTVAALRWYRAVSTARSCPGLDTTGVSRKLVVLAEQGADARRFGFHWLLYDELARILASTGQPSVARRFLRRAMTGAPLSRRPAIESRLADL